MALVITTLGGAVGLNDLTIRVASTAGNAVKNLININGEFMTQYSEVNALVVPVLRGKEATYNQTHASGSVVIMGLPSEFPPPPPGTVTVQPYAPTWNVVSYNAAGTIAVPTIRQNQYVKLKSGAGSAMLLADPGYGIEGTEMLIQAEDAQAYTVSNLGGSGFNGGTTGSDIGTFGGAIGDNLHIKAVAGVWNVINKVNVTLA